MMRSPDTRARTRRRGREAKRQSALRRHQARPSNRGLLYRRRRRHAGSTRRGNLNLHFSPPDGRGHAIRPPGLRCACLPCSTYCSSTPARAKRLAPFSSARLAPSPDGPLTHFTSPRGEKCRLTANVTVSEEEIAANVPAYSIPASVMTTIEGETPAPQSLEIRNSGQGTLNYQIVTDQSWLSVRSTPQAWLWMRPTTSTSPILSTSAFAG